MCKRTWSASLLGVGASRECPSGKTMRCSSIRLQSRRRRNTTTTLTRTTATTSTTTMTTTMTTTIHNDDDSGRRRRRRRRLRTTTTTTTTTTHDDDSRRRRQRRVYDEGKSSLLFRVLESLTEEEPKLTRVCGSRETLSPSPSGAGGGALLRPRASD